MNTKAPPQKAAQDPAAAKKVAGKIVTNMILVTLVLMAAIIGLVLLKMTFVAVMLVIGLMPSIVAHILDRRPGKAASHTILAFNMAGLLKHIMNIFTGGNPNQTAQHLITDPYTWLWVYIFAAFGWLVVHILPQIAILFLSLKAEYTVKRMKSLQEKLASEWGDDIKK